MTRRTAESSFDVLQLAVVRNARSAATAVGRWRGKDEESERDEGRGRNAVEGTRWPEGAGGHSLPSLLRASPTEPNFFPKQIVFTPA